MTNWLVWQVRFKQSPFPEVFPPVKKDWLCGMMYVQSGNLYGKTWGGVTVLCAYNYKVFNSISNQKLIVKTWTVMFKIPNPKHANTTMGTLILAFAFGTSLRWPIKKVYVHVGFVFFLGLEIVVWLNRAKKTKKRNQKSHKIQAPGQRGVCVAVSNTVQYQMQRSRRSTVSPAQSCYQVSVL